MKGLNGRTGALECLEASSSNNNNTNNNSNIATTTATTTIHGLLSVAPGHLALLELSRGPTAGPRDPKVKWSYAAYGLMSHESMRLREWLRDRMVGTKQANSNQ